MHRPLPQPTTPPRGLLLGLLLPPPLFFFFIFSFCCLGLFHLRIRVRISFLTSTGQNLSPHCRFAPPSPTAAPRRLPQRRPRSGLEDGGRGRTRSRLAGGCGGGRTAARRPGGRTDGRSGEVGPGIGPPRGLSFAVVFTRRRPRTPSRRQITKQKGGIVPFRFQFDRLEARLTPSARPTRPSPPTPVPTPPPAGPRKSVLPMRAPNAARSLSPFSDTLSPPQNTASASLEVALGRGRRHREGRCGRGRYHPPPSERSRYVVGGRGSGTA